MEYTFKVKGMHCPSCAMLIENEIDEMVSGADCDCSYKKMLLTIKSDQNLDKELIKRKIIELGYEVEG